MIGPTLHELRTRIESLASETGEYYLVCGRYGDRPVPATGLRFESRSVARRAARVTERYRQTLRRYDPQLPSYDVIVCQDSSVCRDDATASNSCSDGETDAASDATESDRWALTEPVLDGVSATKAGGATGDRPIPRRPLTEFCHAVAAAVFESLSDRSFDAVESAVMETYFDFAESVTDPDELCLVLLESMATALASTLSPLDQQAVLSDVASRLESTTVTGDSPVDAAFDHLTSVGALGSYTRSPWSLDLDEGSWSVVFCLSGYAFDPQAGRFPTLPVVVDLYRHADERTPATLRVTDLPEGWQVQVVFDPRTDPSGLASAAIH